MDVAAPVIRLAERKDNPDFTGDGTYADGIWHGMWFIIITFVGTRPFIPSFIR